MNVDNKVLDPARLQGTVETLATEEVAMWVRRGWTLVSAIFSGDWPGGVDLTLTFKDEKSHTATLTIKGTSYGYEGGIGVRAGSAAILAALPAGTNKNVLEQVSRPRSPDERCRQISF